MPVVKTESVEDRLNCYPKAEEFMQTTFPSTETMLETSSCGTVKVGFAKLIRKIDISLEITCFYSDSVPIASIVPRRRYQ